MKLEVTLTTEAAAVLKEMFENGELDDIGVVGLTEIVSELSQTGSSGESPQPDKKHKKRRSSAKKSSKLWKSVPKIDKKIEFAIGTTHVATFAGMEGHTAYFSLWKYYPINKSNPLFTPNSPMIAGVEFRIAYMQLSDDVMPLFAELKPGTDKKVKVIDHRPDANLTPSYWVLVELAEDQ